MVSLVLRPKKCGLKKRMFPLKISIFIFFLSLSVKLLPAQSSVPEWQTHSDSLFSTCQSTHFTVHYIETEYIVHNLDRVIDQREKGYSKIKDFLELKEDVSIHLFLFPSEKKKFEVTGHRGLGWGFDNNIVEVVNDSVEVDPYHEMAHVLAYRLGKPPAMLD